MRYNLSLPSQKEYANHRFASETWHWFQGSGSTPPTKNFVKERPPPPLLNPPRVSEREKLVIVRFLGYPSERKENNTNDLKEIKLSIKAS